MAAAAVIVEKGNSKGEIVFSYTLQTFMDKVTCVLSMNLNKLSTYHSALLEEIYIFH